MRSRARIGYYSFLGAVTALPLALAGGCAGDGDRHHEPASRAARAPAAPEPGRGAPVACAERVPLYENGERVGERCVDTLANEGLTLIDLSNDWAPRIFSQDPPPGEAGREPYRATYLALADEQRATTKGTKIDFERFLELYGVFPNLRVLRERLRDDARFRCHDAVDDAPLARVEAPLRPTLGIAAVREARRLAYQRQLLETAAKRRQLSDVSELRGDRRHGRLFAQYERLRATGDAIAVIQAHLVCDGLLGGEYTRGTLDYRTLSALRDFQRMHMIIGRAGVDDVTLAAMQVDARELVFRQVLRALRERTAEAAGLLEDGSAVGRYGTVLGRHLDPPDLMVLADREPLERGAADYISPATEAVALALGTTAPARARAFLEALPDGALSSLRVAVRLPPPPPWHSEHMELAVVIDRGDVSYDPPYTLDGRPRGSRVRQRPTLTIAAVHQGAKIPLVRWSTTIGGWQPELLPEGGVAMRYKLSPPGPRIWRDLVASPAWLPPDDTPGEDLVRRNGRGGWMPNRRLLGPSHASAYGLVMLVNHKQRFDKTGAELEPGDEGVRVHGSANYASIGRGTSHGCHRLFNHLAVRLGDFLLGHRRHVRRGPLPASWARTVVVEGQVVNLAVRTRGYGYELTPPVPVEVLEGRIVSRRKRVPLGPFPLRETLVEAARVAAGEASAPAAASAPPLEPAVSFQ